MELYGAPKDSAWEKEFQPETDHGELDALSLSLVFAAQFLPHVFSERIKVLPLSALSSHLMTTIETTFASGSFLSLLPSSCSFTPSGQLSLTAPAGPMQPSFPYDGPGPWRQSAPLSSALKVLMGSPLFFAVPSFASITARILPLLTESSSLDGWSTLEAVVTRLGLFASNVENDWAQSALARIENEDDIASDSREVATNIWTVLKTLLFTTIMLLQSILSTIAYSHPVTSAVTPPKSKGSLTHLPTHSSLALSTLRTLSHLSFVITKFGGVTSTSSAGFAELKRVFYTALDVLSGDVEASETFVKALSLHVAASSSTGEHPADPLTRARQAFNLACVEQLVPLLSLDTIEYCVFPLCLPHLNDASHRETYESAHSTILAIFAAQLGSTTSTEDRDTGVVRSTFVEKIVPFYMQCLLENSVDGKLTTPQLRLTYNALTSSASGNAPAMGQLCLSSLVSLLTRLSEAGDAQRRHRLRLVLVSTLSALPAVVLPYGLDAVSDAIRDSKDEERWELVREVFKEILENMGDREKGYCLRWWEEQRDALEGSIEVENDKEKRIGEASSALSRL